MAAPSPRDECNRLRQELQTLQRELQQDSTHLQQLIQSHASQQQIAEWSTTVSLKREEVDAARQHLLASGCLQPSHPPPPPPPVIVTGIEVTQAIQDPNNRIPLINQKPTVVRVYCKSVTSTSLPNVTCRLTVQGSRAGAHIPVNAAAITVTPSGSDRRSLNDSFAFLLDPTETATGSRSIAVHVYSGDPRRNVRLAHREMTISFSTPLPDMRFHTYGVSYGYTGVDAATQGQNGLTSSDWPAKPGPGEQGDAFEPQRQWAENVYPVHQLQVLPAPGNPHPNFDYDAGSGYLSAVMWGQRLVDMMFPNGGERIYMLQPESVDYNGAHYVDLVGNHVMNGQDGGDHGPTFAHELGHSWGLPHTFDPGSSYPESDGWLGNDVGVRLLPQLTLIPGDTAAGNKVAFDIMSYSGSNYWSSPFNYCLLLNAISGGVLQCGAGAGDLVQPW